MSKVEVVISANVNDPTGTYLEIGWNRTQSVEDQHEVLDALVKVITALRNKTIIPQILKLGKKYAIQTNNPIIENQLELALKEYGDNHDPVISSTKTLMP